LSAAGIAPALDRFQDRLPPVAAEVVVDVDDEQGRAAAEPGPRTVARRGEHRLVTLGQEPIPDGLRHDGLLLRADSMSRREIRLLSPPCSTTTESRIPLGPPRNCHASAPAASAHSLDPLCSVQ